MAVLVRLATPADADIICEFNCLLAHESEGKDLDRSLLLQGVRALLADPRKGLYFLAVVEGRIAGQISVTYEWSDWRHGWFWWIQSVYVSPEARRQGIFRRLLEHVHEAARRDPEVIGLRLYVERDNDAAQATYRALAFAPTTYQVMERYPL